MSKGVPVGNRKGRAIQFRFDAFNLPNHTNFFVPGNSLGSASFGVIGTALESRDLQLGFKFYF